MSQSPLLIPFEGFLQLLQDNGFEIGVDQYVRIQVLLNKLPADTPASQMKSILAPIFVNDELEQEKFYRLFDAYFRALLPETPFDESGEEDTELPPSRLRKWLVNQGILDQEDLSDHQEQSVLRRWLAKQGILDDDDDEEGFASKREKLQYHFLRFATHPATWGSLLLIVSIAIGYISYSSYISYRGTDKQLGAHDYFHKYNLESQENYLQYTLGYIWKDLVGKEQICDDLEEVKLSTFTDQPDDSTFVVVIRPTNIEPEWKLIWVGINDSIMRDSIYKQELSIQDTGTYEVVLRIENAAGCNITLSQSVDVKPEVECQVSFSYAPSPENPQQINFTGNVQKDPSDSFTMISWDFGDKSLVVKDSLSISHAFEDYGTYQVCFEIETLTGCKQKFCQRILITNPDSLQNLLSFGGRPFQSIEIPEDWSSSPISPYYPLFLVLFLFLFGFFYEIYRVNRRRLARNTPRNDTGPYTWPIVAKKPATVFSADLIYTIAKHLRKRQPSNILHLDMPGTIQKTIESKGYPHFAYKLGSRPSEYLILIEQQSVTDHQAAFYRQLVREIAKQDVYLDIFFFRGEPTAFFRHENDRAIYLNDLRIRYPDHRLVIMGSGEYLTDPYSGQLNQAYFDLLSFKDRAILTPTPPIDWGFQEVTLSKYFLILPGLPIVLSQLLDYLAMDTAPRLKNWVSRGDLAVPDLDASDTELVDLQTYLGQEGFFLLAACAVYPECHWDLTVALGQDLLGKERLTPDLLLKLVRLPFFRKGHIPEHWRRQLIQALPEDLRSTVHGTIVRMLLENPPPEGTVAHDRHEVFVTVHRWQKEKESATNLQPSALIEAYEERGEIEDPLALKGMSHQSWLASLQAEEGSWKRFLFRKGYTVLGFRSWVRATLVILFSLVFILPLYWDDLIRLNSLSEISRWLIKPSKYVQIEGKYYQLRTATDSALYFSHTGEAFLNQEDYGSAYNEFSEAIEKQPFNPLYYYQRGTAILALATLTPSDSLLQQAFEDFSRADVLRPAFRTFSTLAPAQKRAYPNASQAAVSPKGRYYALARNNSAQLFQIGQVSNPGIMGPEPFAHPKPISAMLFSPNDQYLIVAAGETLYLWSTNSGKQVGTVTTPHEYPIISLAFSKDGKQLATGGADNLATLWNLTQPTPQLFFELEGTHSDSIIDIDFSPSGKFLVTTSADSSATIWNTQTGKAGSFLSIEERGLTQVRFLSDENFVIMGHPEGAYTRWDIRSGSRFTTQLANQLLFDLQTWPDRTFVGLTVGNRESQEIQFICWDPNQNMRMGKFLTKDFLPIVPKPAEINEEESKEVNLFPYKPRMYYNASDSLAFTLLPKDGLEIYNLRNLYFLADTLKLNSQLNRALVAYKRSNFQLASGIYKRIIAQAKRPDVQMSAEQRADAYLGQSLAMLEFFRSEGGVSGDSSLPRPSSLTPAPTANAIAEQKKRYLDALAFLNQGLQIHPPYLERANQILNLFVDTYADYNSLSDMRQEICQRLSAFNDAPCDLFDLKNIGRYSEGLAAMETVNGWGYLDEEHQTVIPPQFYTAGPFINGLAKVQPDPKRTWLINAQGESMYIEVSGPFDELLLCQDVKSNRWGYINNQSHLIRIPFVYDEAEPFYNGYAKVRQGEKWGFVDLLGESSQYGGIVYDRISGDFRKDLVTAFRDGKAVTLRYNDSPEDPSPKDVQEVQDSDSSRTAPATDASDSTGAIPPPPPSPSVPVLPYTIEGKEFNGRIRASQNGLYGFLAKNPVGKKVQNKTAPPSSDYRVVVSFQYANAYDFSFQRAAVRRKDGNWGFIDINGTRRTPFVYERVSAYSSYGKKDILAKVKAADDIFYIDLEGNCVEQKGFPCPTVDMDDEYMPQGQDETYVVANNKDLTVFKEGNLYGLRSTNNPSQILLPALSTVKIIFSGQFARVRNQKGNWGMINMQGRLVIELKYSGIKNFSNGFAAVQSMGKWGFVDTNGKLVIGFKFEEIINSFANGRAYVLFNNKKTTIDSRGNVVGGRKTKSY
ncbi:MAG: WG repeat-containing protein [Bacteroidota bacterium]